MSYQMSDEEKERVKQSLKEYWEKENLRQWAWRILRVTVIIYVVLAFIAGWYLNGWLNWETNKRLWKEDKTLYNTPLYQLEVIRFGDDKVGLLRFNQRTGVGEIFYVNVEDWYKGGIEEVIPYAYGDNPYE